MPEMVRKQFDLVIVGAGPAGLAAAASAAECGARVGLLDDNPELGGQIWRGDAMRLDPLAAAWKARVEGAKVEILCGTTAVHHQVAVSRLFAAGPSGALAIDYDKLILATGARERFVPFPGWTLPNVMAAGGMQAMAKAGLPVRGKRIVIAGTGPLLLAVAAYLRQHGATIELVCEQARWSALAGFGASLWLAPSKLAQALQLRSELRGVRFWANAWPVRAHGSDRLESVVIRRGEREQQIACDYLACGFHLVPNVELAQGLGCRVANGRVVVDAEGHTSLENVYCAGEPTGIGGLEMALLEGEIAGFAAAGECLRTAALLRQRRKLESFSARMNKTFQLRPELKSLPENDTIVCRCEDVTYARARRFGSWRDAKNQTRCGMGPCQGRICGPATQFLYDWQMESLRPPIFPVSLEMLTAMTGIGEQQ